MRISDWSSDVCSSDLLPVQRNPPPFRFFDRRQDAAQDVELVAIRAGTVVELAQTPHQQARIGRVEKAGRQQDLVQMRVEPLHFFGGRRLVPRDRTSTRLNSSP